MRNPEAYDSFEFLERLIKYEVSSQQMENLKEKIRLQFQRIKDHNPYLEYDRFVDYLSGMYQRWHLLPHNTPICRAVEIMDNEGLDFSKRGTLSQLAIRISRDLSGLLTPSAVREQIRRYLIPDRSGKMKEQKDLTDVQRLNLQFELENKVAKFIWFLMEEVPLGKINGILTDFQFTSASEDFMKEDEDRWRICKRLAKFICRGKE